MLENCNGLYLASSYARQALKTCASSFSSLQIKKSCRIWPLTGASEAAHCLQNIILTICAGHLHQGWVSWFCVQRCLILTQLMQVYRTHSGYSLSTVIIHVTLPAHTLWSSKIPDQLKAKPALIQTCKDKFRYTALQVLVQSCWWGTDLSRKGCPRNAILFQMFRMSLNRSTNKGYAHSVSSIPYR